jgi:hypothetical protein
VEVSLNPKLSTHLTHPDALRCMGSLALTFATSDRERLVAPRAARCCCPPLAVRLADVPSLVFFLGTSSKAVRELSETGAGSPPFALRHAVVHHYPFPGLCMLACAFMVRVD